MRRSKSFFEWSQLIIGILALFAAINIGEIVDSKGVTFHYLKPFSITTNLDSVISRGMESGDENYDRTVQLFSIKNLSNNHDIVDLRYEFISPNLIDEVKILDGDQIILLGSFTISENKTSATLKINQLPPLTEVVGSISYFSDNKTTTNKLRVPMASASNISPQNLILVKSQGVNNSLKIVLGIALAIFGFSIIFYTFKKVKTKVKVHEGVKSDFAGINLITGNNNVLADGKIFAETGCDHLYWFKVPLGGITHDEGFRFFLKSALDNQKINRIRFVLDKNQEKIKLAWYKLVIPRIQEWAKNNKLDYKLVIFEDKLRGTFFNPVSDRAVEWIFVDLSKEFSPSFKVFLDDSATDDLKPHLRAQIFLGLDKTDEDISVPSTIINIDGNLHQGLLRILDTILGRYVRKFDVLKRDSTI